MTDDNGPAGPETDVTAAELALGLLEGAERAAALRRMLADPAFAHDVEQWRAHFGVLFDAAPQVAPPANGLARLEAAIASPANDAGTIRVRRWQGIAAITMLVAASLLLVIALRPGSVAPGAAPKVVDRARPAPVLVAQIIPVAKGAVIPAVYDPATGSLRIAPARFADAAHSAELWVIPGDGVARSLGVLNPSGSTDVGVKTPNRAHFAPGTTLAITVEQRGGSPDGKARGAVVASGALILI